MTCCGAFWKIPTDNWSLWRRRLRFSITYLRLRITNAASESINSKIQWGKYTARGFRNKKNFVTAIYFHAALSTQHVTGPRTPQQPPDKERLQGKPSPPQHRRDSSRTRLNRMHGGKDRAGCSRVYRIHAS